MVKLDLITKKNDEYYTPIYAITPILKFIKPNSIIWCPFDIEESLFVKQLKKEGHNVIFTHISNDENFFEYSPVPICDYIISNLPYSLKTEILDYLFKLKIPFAMLIGIVGLFESKKRFELFKNNKFEILYFDKRISFFDDYKNINIKYNPPFSSVYICHNFLPEKIMFEKINKKLIN